MYAWAFLIRNLQYRYAVRRHAWLDPYSTLSVLIHAVYVGSNVLCLTSRAVVLCLANMGPVLLAPHLSFLADFFCVSLRTFRQVHRACGLVSASLLLARVIAVTLQTSATTLSAWSLRCAITVCRSACSSLFCDA